MIGHILVGLSAIGALIVAALKGPFLPALVTIGVICGCYAWLQVKRAEFARREEGHKRRMAELRDEEATS